MLKMNRNYHIGVQSMYYSNNGNNNKQRVLKLITGAYEYIEYRYWINYILN